MNNLNITLSDEEMTKIKIVHSDGLYYFVVDDFFSWSRSLIKKFYLKFSNFEFQISNCSNRSDGEMTKIIFFCLDEFYNFSFGDFSIWNHLLTPILFEIVNFYSNEPICKYNSCRSRLVLQLCCLWFLHLKQKKIDLKLYLKFS